MDKIEIYKPDESTEYDLPYADGGIHAGFPSPAQDYMCKSLDLNKLIIRHPSSTFYGRVVGDSMIGEDIAQGDIVVIDKSLEPCNGDIAVCFVDGEFTLKFIDIRNGKLFLCPANSNYPEIEIAEGDDFRVWGVVTHTIRNHRKHRNGITK
ncbi:MAG: translesion error-prone DNA polymerase V autoproteolytic subunit [Bacteroidales bacterium]|nr:translesion error-prone DNA polymerase V autoproteolytic subunit [Bacteroidales bacterium]